MVAPLIAAAAAAGLPLLADLVTGALRRINNPVAQTAAAALEGVSEAVRSGDIGPEQMTEANRHLEEMTRLSNEREIAFQGEVNKTMRTEATSEDAWTRRWRPFFGYIVAVTWGVQMAALAYTMIIYPTLMPQIISAMGDGMATMWSVALAVLGVAVVKRSEDKAIAQSVEPPSVLGRLANVISSRRSGQ